jgi:hypothetical protein
MSIRITTMNERIPDEIRHEKYACTFLAVEQLHGAT